MGASVQRCEVSAPATVLEGETLSHHYGRNLLQTLGFSSTTAPDRSVCRAALARDAARDWADSGLMALTGCPSGPVQRAQHVVPSCARGALLALETLAGQGLSKRFDGAAVLSGRSKILGLGRRGGVSANGSCHLLLASGGYLALNLARAEDWRALPAWLQARGPIDNWEQIATLIAQHEVEHLLARGRMLALPVAAVATAPAAPPRWYRQHVLGQRRAGAVNNRTPLVVDLSALWAGPLCGQLLQQAGARVIKVESCQRPDAARSGSRLFYAVLNAGKQSVQLDLHTSAGRKSLLTLLHAADIVIESSRPRALRQMGIDARSILAQSPGKLWLGLTGYGQDEPQQHWVAFGDDAAAAGGLCTTPTRAGAGPYFCGDALADPLAGLHAAVAVLGLWRRGQGGLLDINLRDVAAYCGTFQRDLSAGTVRQSPRGGKWVLVCEGQTFQVREPAVPKVFGTAVESGADTASVLREFAAC